MMRFDDAIEPRSTNSTNHLNPLTAIFHERVLPNMAHSNDHDTNVVFRIATKAREILPNDPGHDQVEVFLDFLSQVYNALDATDLETGLPLSPEFHNDYDLDIDI